MSDNMKRTIADFKTRIGYGTHGKSIWWGSTDLNVWFIWEHLSIPIWFNSYCNTWIVCYYSLLYTWIVLGLELQELFDTVHTVLLESSCSVAWYYVYLNCSRPWTAGIVWYCTYLKAAATLHGMSPTLERHAI
jgi:hypothetical protein